MVAESHLERGENLILSLNLFGISTLALNDFAILTSHPRIRICVDIESKHETKNKFENFLKNLAQGLFSLYKGSAAAH